MSYSDYYYEERKKHQIKDKEEKNLILYIPCYDVINKEIYFFDFFTEEIVDLNSIDPSEVLPNPINQDNNFIEYNPKIDNMKKILPIVLSADENEKLEKHLLKFHQNWEKMKILTKFNAISSLGGEYKNYFRRPYYSRFFLSEKLKLYSFNSTTNIPQVLKTYTMRIEISFDPCKLEDRDFFTKEEEDKLKNSPYINDISLTTIVDSLIKEVVDYFYLKLDQDKSKLQQLNKDGPKYIHVLKFKEREEYLFGDSLIGAYHFIRGRLRQHETIYFYLKILPLYIVSPPVTSFPPIIRATKTNENYINLLKSYLKQYFPNNGIIYRLLRPDERIKKRFLKQKYKRNEKLSRFTESCDCCFPLWIKIKHLNNIYSLKYWFDDEEYNKNEMLIPNLKFYERKKLMSNLGKTIKGMSLLDKNSNNLYEKKEIKNERASNIMDEKMMKDKIKNSENEMRKKSLILMEKKGEKDKDLQNSLNRLSVTKSNLLYYPYTVNPMYSSAINFSPDIGECIDLLSTDELRLDGDAKKVSSTENKRIYVSENIKKPIYQEEEKNSNKDDDNNKNETEKKENNNEYYDRQYTLDKLLKNKYNIFILDQYQLPFSPSFLRINISLLYGSYSILSFKSEPFLFENHINLNDKFIFDNSRCLISNLPFETRIAVTIEAYEKSLKKCFTLGSCQIPLYRSDGQIQSGHIKINIWPNINVSPRFNNCSSFGLSTKHKNKIDALEKGTYPDNAEKFKSEIMEKMEPDFKNIIKIYNIEKKEKDNEKNIDILIRKNQEKEKKKIWG